MSNTWHVQTAETKDIPDLVSVRLAYLSEDHGELSAEHTEIIKKDLPVYFQNHLNKDIICFIIRNDDILIASGFLLIIEKPMNPSFINGRTGTVLNVYTAPAFRHQGCGRAVMHAILREAEKQDLCHVELQATEDGFPLYAACGFQESISKYHAMKWFNPSYEK